MIVTVEDLAKAMPDVSRLESCEPQMETPQHYDQLAMLVACAKWLLQGRQDVFIGANLTVYFSEEQVRNRDFRGPDFFVVKDVEPRERSSWVVWHEGGRYPDFILELLSDSTSSSDRGPKKELYQTRFRTPEYFWFSPQTLEFAGFRLISGAYQPIPPNDLGWLWSEVLELYLGVREGQLRFFFPNGDLVPTPEELAERERRQRLETEAALETERQALEAERQRNEALLKLLRDRGIDPGASFQ